jgi:thioredoxin domain-containing protein 5
VQTAGNTALAIPPIHIYTSTSPELRSQYGADSHGPTIIALKAAHGKSGEMEYIPTAHFPVTQSITHSEIHSFLNRNAIPLVTELNSDNFQTIMTAKAFDPKPLVVIMAAKPGSKAEAAKLLSAGEENWRRECKEKGSPPRDVLWTYMDGDKWGSWLKSMYGIKSGKMPTYVVADHSVRTFTFFDTFDPSHSGNRSFSTTMSTRAEKAS